MHLYFHALQMLKEVKYDFEISTTKKMQQLFLTSFISSYTLEKKKTREKVEVLNIDMFIKSVCSLYTSQDIDLL